MDRFVLVPWRELAPETLQAVIEEFVTRDGTDNGYVEGDLDKKIATVKRMLERGEAHLGFDHATGTCNIVSSRDAGIFP